MIRNQSFSFASEDLEGHQFRYTDDEDESSSLLFDISWEVARKVGGIYTVMRTKAPETVKEYGDRYALVGPYFESVTAEFEPIEPSSLTKTVLERLYNVHGVKAHFGRWLVKGYPRVFLLELGSSSHRLSEMKKEIGNGFDQVDDLEVHDAIIFGYQVAYLLESICHELGENGRVIAHFHEWLTGMGLVTCNRMLLRVATIFTTHATLIGRYIAAGGLDLYHDMEHFDADKQAAKRGIYPKHWIEKAAAHSAKVFTTVSDITAYEAEHLLHRKPDIVTPNGLETLRFTALHEFQNLHLKYKLVLNEFTRGHFSGNLDFDIDNTLYFFTAGRYEITNKGVDHFLEALSSLNHKMKVSGSKTTVIAFIIMPSKTSNYNIDSLRGQALMKECKRRIDEILNGIGERLIDSTARGKLPDTAHLLSAEDMVMLKRSVLQVQQRKNPAPIVTHNMIDEHDELLDHIRRVQLFNKPEDRVKVIFHPEFLTRTNPLIPLDYSEFVRGCHLGVFPSYYEPWGYTPAECTMMGVPSVSSNLTGFANYLTTKVPEHDQHGIFVVDRRFKTRDESIAQLTNCFWRFVNLDRRQRIELRNRTERLSPLLDWKTLGQYYIDARRIASDRTF